MISNCDVFSHGKVVTDRSIVLQGSTVAGWAGEEEVPGYDRVLDLKGMSISRGFIDFKVTDFDGVSLGKRCTQSQFDFVVECHVQAGTVALYVAAAAAEPDAVERLVDRAVAFRTYPGAIKGVNTLNVPSDGRWIEALLAARQRPAPVQLLVTNRQGSLDPAAIAELRDGGVEVLMTAADPVALGRIAFACEIVGSRGASAPLLAQGLAPCRSEREPDEADEADGQFATASSALKYLVQKRGVTRLNAIRLKTEACAAALSVPGYTGRIDVGGPAELVVLDNEMNVRSVIFGEDHLIQGREP